MMRDIERAVPGMENDETVGREAKAEGRANRAVHPHLLSMV